MSELAGLSPSKALDERDQVNYPRYSCRPLMVSVAPLSENEGHFRDYGPSINNYRVLCWSVSIPCLKAAKPREEKGDTIRKDPSAGNPCGQSESCCDFISLALSRHI